MGSKTRLSSYCNKRGDNTVNLVYVTSRKTIARLARPIMMHALAACLLSVCAGLYEAMVGVLERWCTFSAPSKSS